MSIHNADSGKLYDLVGRHVGALPEGTQTSTRAQLDGLRAITTRTDAAFERVEKTAQAREAARPIADAALKRAMQPKILGMTPTAAIVGAIAVGSIAIAATKLLRSGEKSPEEGKWASRISQERANFVSHGAVRRVL